MKSNRPKLAVIGAGLAALNLARIMSSVADVVIYEKSDKLCGRISTHHSNEFSFDHGAQFFTAKSPEFKSFVRELESNAVVEQWSARFVEFESVNIKKSRKWEPEFPHYVGIPSMNSIGKYLAKNLDIRFNQLITGLKKIDSNWYLDTYDSRHVPFDWIVITMPAEQTFQILPEEFHYRREINELLMKPCFALMLGYNSSKYFDWDAAFVSNSILSWISINSSKPKRNDPLTIVALSSNDWAKDHFSKDDSIVITQMLQELESICNKKLDDHDYLKLKRWKYANASRNSIPLQLIDTRSQLACCGDWCISGRVESAFSSSFDTAKKLKAIIGSPHGESIYN